MKVFCTSCGAPAEVAPSVRVVTCAACGQQFNAAPATGAPAHGSGRALWVVMGLVVLLFLCCVGSVVIGAIRNFMQFGARAKQSECKTNLKAIYTAERSYFDETDAYDTRVAKVGFAPERGNRYAYFLDATGPLQEQGASALEGATGVAVDVSRYPSGGVSLSDVPPLSSIAGSGRPGVEGTCPTCGFTAVCAGNVDADPVLDIWSISTKDRVAPGGTPIPAGQPYHDVDDLR